MQTVSWGRVAHGMRNESSLISEGAFDCLSLPFSFRKDEIFLVPSQTKVRALNEPVKPIQAKVQLVAHPVGVGSGCPLWGSPVTLSPNEVGHRRGSFQTFFVAPFPNRAGDVNRTRLSREHRS